MSIWPNITEIVFNNISKIVKYSVIAIIAAALVMTILFIGIFDPFNQKNQDAVELYKSSGKPILTTAGIIHVCPENKIALIERGKAPFGIAFFGGHIEAKESPETAFRRELKEELNINDVASIALIGVHGNYGRDPRQHSVEVTYTATVSSNPKAGSDASSVSLYTIEDLKQKLSHKENFAFDHGNILEKYLNEINDCNPCNDKCLISPSSTK